MLAIESKLKTKTMNKETVFRYLKKSNNKYSLITCVHFYFKQHYLWFAGEKAIILEDLILVPKFRRRGRLPFKMIVQDPSQPHH